MTLKTKLTGEDKFNDNPPTYHWVFIAFIITAGFIVITWILPVPGICFGNIVVSTTLFVIFMVLYINEYNDNKEQYQYNLMNMFASKFQIDLNDINKKALKIKKNAGFADDTDNELDYYFQLITGKKKIFDADPIGFSDYGKVKVQTET